MNEITWHESAIWFFIAQKLLFANQYVRKFHKISKFSKNFQIIKFSKNFKIKSKIEPYVIRQLLHLNLINMRLCGAEYNNIERGEAEFNIVVLCSIKPHIDLVQVQ